MGLELAIVRSPSVLPLLVALVLPVVLLHAANRSGTVSIAMTRDVERPVFAVISIGILPCVMLGLFASCNR
jgi:hypothetical protein